MLQIASIRWLTLTGRIDVTQHELTLSQGEKTKKKREKMSQVIAHERMILF
jgi:hypothetical protein